MLHATSHGNIAQSCLVGTKPITGTPAAPCPHSIVWVNFFTAYSTHCLPWPLPATFVKYLKNTNTPEHNAFNNACSSLENKIASMSSCLWTLMNSQLNNRCQSKSMNTYFIKKFKYSKPNSPSWETSMWVINQSIDEGICWGAHHLAHMSKHLLFLSLTV